MITLDDAALLALAGRPDVAAAFPALGRVRPAEAACCGRRPKGPSGLEEARRELGELPPERGRLLAALLGSPVRVYYRAGREVRKAEYPL